MSSTDTIPGKLQALVEIVRPGNVLIMMLGVVVGLVIEVGVEHAFDGHYIVGLLAAALSVALIGAGANVHNDVVDLETDRLNRPARVLPSRRLKSGFALRLGHALTFMGLALSLGVSIIHAGVALG